MPRETRKPRYNLEERTIKFSKEIIALAGKIKTSNINSLFLVFILAIIIYSFTLTTRAAQETIINSNLSITQDTVWEGVVILDGARVTVEQNATLSLDPGTTVAGKNGGLIFVVGKLKALGEKDKKIHFTSEYDEDLDYSLAYYINSASASEIEMKNFILENGGGNKDIATVPALTIKGKASLSECVIRRNRNSAVRIWNVNIAINNCEIYENESLALENKTTVELKVENNWWGSKDKPRTTSGDGGNWLSGSFDFNPWQEKGPIPIVILPGLGGSFSFKLLSDKASDAWWLNPVGTYAYRYFVKSLILARYYHEKDFFWGFYDWRLPCEESAKKYLEDIIEKAKTESGHSEVHVLAHSMGGLVARAYIQGERYRDDVDRLVTAGTPHLGSSETYAIWEGGELLGRKRPISLYLWYLQALNQNWNRTSFIREKFPSVGQMMPIYDSLVNKESNQLISYESQKINNPFLENLKNQANILRRRVWLGFVAGTGKETLEKIGVKDFTENGSQWEDGIPDPLDPPQDTTKGDGAVIVKSATANNEITEETAVLESSHSDLLKLGQKTIFNELKVVLRDPYINKILNHFLLSAKGPAEIQIEDENGDTIDKSANQIADSQFYTDLSGDELLAYSDFPLDLENDSPKNIRVSFTGQADGTISAAFWNLSDNENFDLVEKEKAIGRNIKLDYELAYRKNMDGNPTIETRSLKYANLLRVLSPTGQNKYLNWQHLYPEAEIWQGDESIKDTSVMYEIDGENASQNIDLSNFNLGDHTLRVIGGWSQNEVAESEEDEISFDISTSCKSLVTLIDRFYRERKILSWNKRSELINLVAEAYQEYANGNAENAKEKLSLARETLDGLDQNIIGDVLVKERLGESLTFLQNEPR